MCDELSNWKIYFAICRHWRAPARARARVQLHVKNAPSKVTTNDSRRMKYYLYISFAGAHFSFHALRFINSVTVLLFFFFFIFRCCSLRRFVCFVSRDGRESESKSQSTNNHATNNRPDARLFAHGAHRQQVATLLNHWLWVVGIREIPQHATHTTNRIEPVKWLNNK